MRRVSSQFEKTGSETILEGGFFTVVRATFRHEDGEDAEREIVRHTGAVGVVVLDGEDLWFVRQPREAVGSPDLLELPAGKLDDDTESPLETAKRELAEEIGKQAEHWEPLGSFYTSPGFTDEEVHLFLASGISDVDERPEVAENERIDVEVRPLSELDAILAGAKDSKTLIGLYRLRERLPMSASANPS
jgi:8-oxo-dGTP pyrophosphatase MutT (NUDIX family)